MKTIQNYFLILLICLCPYIGHAQVFNSGVQNTGPGMDMFKEISFDPSTLNSFVAGSFSGSIVVDGVSGPITLTSSSANDANIVVARLNIMGKAIWAISIGGTGNDFANGVCADASASGANGRIYITGGFTSASINVGATTITNSFAGNSDVFVMAIAKNGTPVWGRSFGNSNQDNAKKIKLRPSTNELVVAGEFTGSINFTGTTLNGNGIYGNIFVASFGIAQNSPCLWARRLGGPSGSNSAEDLRLTNTTCFMHGTTNGTITFGGTTNNTSLPVPAAYGGYDLVLASYNLTTLGTENWVKSMGGSGDDYGRGLELSAYAFNPVVCGSFSGNATFGSSVLSSAGGSDVYIATFDAATGNNNWAVRAGGTDMDEAKDIAIDQTCGRTIVSGFYISPTAFFGSTVLNNLGTADAFATFLSGNGQFIQTVAVAGTGFETANVTLVNNNRVFVYGDFVNTSFTLGSTLLSNPSALWYHNYIGLMDLYPFPGSVSVSASKTQVCPSTENPLVTLTASNFPGHVYSWSPAAALNSTTGNPVVLNTSLLPNGPHTYSVTATDGCNSSTASVTINVECPLGSTSVDVGQNYPNPAEASTTIPYWTSTSTLSADIRFYNLQTGILYTSYAVSLGGTSFTPLQLTIDVSSWPVGSYKYRLENASTYTPYKVLVVQ